MKKFNPVFKGKSFKILNICCVKRRGSFVLTNLPNTISVTGIEKYYISIEDILPYTQRDGSTLCAPNFREQLRYEFLNRLKKPDKHLKENNRHTSYY